MNKRKYLSPQCEGIELELQGMVAASGTAVLPGVEDGGSAY